VTRSDSLQRSLENLRKSRAILVGMGVEVGGVDEAVASLDARIDELERQLAGEPKNAPRAAD
jgi:hypothetical protein